MLFYVSSHYAVIKILHVGSSKYYTNFSITYTYNVNSNKTFNSP